METADAEILLAAVRNAGFPLAGVVDLEPALDRYREHADAYERWIEAGHHGSMEYLRRGLDRRKDPRLVFPEARSVLAVAYPYRASPLGHRDPAKGPRFARYLEGGDYHVSMKDRLEQAMESASRDIEAATGSPLRYKACVDTSAVLERSWAWLAGLGWIGKNSLLIHPRWGSYLFLGAAFLDREFDSEPRPLASYCGHCRRCLDGCPTDAFIGERILDSRRCISALTLEHRGPRPEDPSLRRGFGTWIAGCDLCQEVCPFNGRRSKQAAGTEVLHPTVLSEKDDSWAELLDIELEGSYRARARESAIERVKPAMFRRNLALALGNAVELEPASPEWPALLDRVDRAALATDEHSERAAWLEVAGAIRRAQVREPSSMP